MLQAVGLTLAPSEDVVCGWCSFKAVNPAPSPAHLGTPRGGQVSLLWDTSPGPRVPAVHVLVGLLPACPAGRGTCPGRLPCSPPPLLLGLTSLSAKPLPLLRPRVWQDQPRAGDWQTQCPTCTLSRALGPAGQAGDGKAGGEGTVPIACSHQRF